VGHYGSFRTGSLCHVPLRNRRKFRRLCATFIWPHRRRRPPQRRQTLAKSREHPACADAHFNIAMALSESSGNSAVQENTLLNRRWRNARTLASHNPRVALVRILGAWYLNGTDPIAALWVRGREALDRVVSAKSSAITSGEVPLVQPVHAEQLPAQRSLCISGG